MRTDAGPFQAHVVRVGVAHRMAQVTGQRAQMRLAMGEILCGQIASCVEATREMRRQIVQIVLGRRATRRQA